jgi:hypothetical protein
MSKHIFRMHSLYAGHGDCLWIEYGEEAHPHRIVVDCGTAGTYQCLQRALDFVRDMPGENELLVITHVDSDHIAGALPLLADATNASFFKDIWFNGRRHLDPSRAVEPFGAVQGESLTRALLTNSAPWNLTFGGKSVALSENRQPRSIKLPGGANLTILSPTWEKLRAMQGRWDAEVRAAGLDPAVTPPLPQPIPPGFEAFGFDVNALADWPFDEDNTEPNGTSIAFLLEYESKTMLLGADAHPSVLIDALKALPRRPNFQLDLLKVPHHGSRNNICQELLEKLRCRAALFSSNGAYHEHPHKEAVARVIKYSPPGVELLFNCRSKFNSIWDSRQLRGQWHFNTRYGKAEDGISVHLL